jgi:hypothetical protein
MLELNATALGYFNLKMTSELLSRASQNENVGWVKTHKAQDVYIVLRFRFEIDPKTGQVPCMLSTWVVCKYSQGKSEILQSKCQWMACV